MRRRSVWWPIPMGPWWLWPLTGLANLYWALIYACAWFTMLIFSAAVRAF